MRKLLLIAGFMFAWAAPVLSQSCGVRNDTVTNALGQAIPNIAVTYYTQPSLALATVYSSTTCTPLTNGNPQFTNGLGQATAYLVPGLYTITYSGAQIQTQTLADQQIGGGGGSAVPNPPAYSMQIANLAATGLTSDPNFTIDPINHILQAGPASSGHTVHIGFAGNPPADWYWYWDTPATAFNSISGCTLGTTGYPDCAGIIAPGNPDSDPLQNTFIGNYAGISGFAECSANPVLPVGGSGFDAGSVRDSKIWYARGLYWQLYTGAASATTPYNPTIGIASSPDGCTWTKGGQVIPVNSGIADCAGAVFSPGAYYQASTDELWIYPSCANTGAEWYTGPLYVFQMHVAPGASWTNPANYVWDGTTPVVTATQGWEGAQGTYAADVYLVGGTYYMFYSSNTSGVLYQWGLMTASSPAGPWTKSTTNPITPSGGNCGGTLDCNYEEPAIAQLENGNLVGFGDPVAAQQWINVIDYTGGSLTAAASWDAQPIFQVPGAATWSGSEIGSQTVVESIDGRWLICYDGKASGAGTDQRQIGCAWFKFSPSQNQPISNSLLTNVLYLQNPTGYQANNYFLDFFSNANYSGTQIGNINGSLTVVGDVPFATGVDSVLGPITKIAGPLDFASGTNAATGTTKAGVGLCADNSGVCLATQPVGSSLWETSQLGVLPVQTASDLSSIYDFDATLGTSNSVGIEFGQGSGTSNCALLAFTYAGSGSGSNTGNLGLCGSTNVLTINAAGLVTVPSLTVVGACTGCGTGTNLQTNSVNNSSQSLLNMETSTTNAVGLTVTPSNPSGGIEKFEITGGSYTGNASTSTTAGNLSGTPTVPNGTAATTQSTSDATTKLATDAFVQNNTALSGKLLASPAQLTGQTASIASTQTLLASTPAAGRYLVCVDIELTTAAGSSSTLPQVNIAYTDSRTGNSQLPLVTFSNGSNATFASGGGCEIVNATSGSVIGYRTTGYASSPASVMTYSVGGEVYSAN